MLTNKKHSFKKEVASTATKGYKIALLAGVIILFSVNTTKAQLTLSHSNVFLIWNLNRNGFSPFFKMRFKKGFSQNLT